MLQILRLYITLLKKAIRDIYDINVLYMEISKIYYEYE